MSTGPTLRIGLDASMFTERRTGIGNYVFRLLSALQHDARAHHLRFYLYSHRAIAADCQAFGTCREHVGAWLRKGPLWLSLSLPAWLRRDGIDLFWGANGYLPLRLPAGTRAIVTVFDRVYARAGHTMPWHSRWARRLLQPAAVRQADAVITISQTVAAEVASGYHRQPEGVITPLMDPVFVPPSAEEVARVRAAYGLEGAYFLSVGTLEPRKNVLALIEAHDRLARDLGAACPPLVLAGAKGWLDQGLQERLGPLTARGQVRWLGFVPTADMPALYRAARAFLFFPLYEGYGMPVREALLCGAQVLCADMPALREAGLDRATYSCGHGVDDIEAALRACLAWPPGTSPKGERPPVRQRPAAESVDTLLRLIQTVTTQERLA